MATIEELLGGESLVPSLVIRPPLPGEYGWVIQRHGALYAREYGFDTSFEALVAQIVASYLEHYDPARERCWIAALRRRAGRLRLLRGRGRRSREAAPADRRARSARSRRSARSLVEECIRFARAVGYRELTLWTQRHLVAARRIYERCGFELVESEKPAVAFGTRQVSETWRLVL